MKLTLENYFTQNNRYLSNSKVGDWLRDKNYFYRKNITREITREITDPLIIGSAVDYWIMNGEDKFRERYLVVSRRSKKQPDYEYQLNQTMFTNIEKMAKNISSQTAFKHLEGYKCQEILQVEGVLGEHFDGLCGIPDWYKVDGDQAFIVDLKTAENANPQKYYYKCEEYGYFRQAAFYAFLLEENFKIKKENITYRHLVVEKDKLGINNVYAFILPERKVFDAYEDLLNVITDISTEKDFAPHDADWVNAIML